MRILVAAVGNVLRRDDGFGPAVAERLAGSLPDECTLVETGIGGVALLQDLMTGYDGLVLIDAMDGQAAPGSVFLVTPEVGEAVHVPDVHLANPERVLTMAKTLGVLPDRLLIVGCQPEDTEELGAGLSDCVERGVQVAARKVAETVGAWLEEEEARAAL